MKILLINPPQSHKVKSNLPAFVDDTRGHLPPLGLMYITAIAEKEHDCTIVDMLAGEPLENYKDTPDLVGITATTFNVVDALEVARTVKRWWNPKVILGGIHPSIYPLETQAQEGVDYAFTGEAESSIIDTLRQIDKGTCPPVVKGSAVDVTQIPFPARHKIDKERYFSVLGKRRYITSMFTSRGCPFHCIFCHRRTMGRVFRARTAAQVIGEIKSIKDMGVDEVTIYDETFTVDKQRVKDICTGLITDRVGVALDIRTRVDCVNEETLSLLKEAGCERIHYGVEASSDRILKILNKGITLEQVERVFKLTQKLGIEILAYFIIGSPGETVEDIEHTIKYAKKLNPEYCLFSIMTPFPDTPMYTMGIKEGRYPDYWAEFALHPSNNYKGSWHHEIPDEELERLAQKAYQKFYWRPKQILREAKKVTSPSIAIKKGKSALGMLSRR